MTAERIRYLDVDFDLLEQDEVLALLGARDPAAPFGYWVTPNVDHVVRLHQDRSDDREAVWDSYRHATLSSCDSRILAVIARRYGKYLPVAPGSDMTQLVLDRLCRPGDRIAIVGGTATTAASLAGRYPQLDIVQHQPPMGMRRNPAAMDAAAAFVAQARARFTFLAVGSPQQELLARHVLRRGDAVGMGLCIGAAIEFVVGESRRAPRVVQRMHLEWAFRLMADPVRLWKRYLVTGPRIFALARAEGRRDPPGT
ncbi:WecB/TagA/CpsF family glycosyltransferase [Sphingomonas sp. KR1UV-12]|uniref:WecB/TagA/CpsF family glycosyltransferase n=1 Tax=Sphingomonas aurea TaxID=3063994 RepID=A0ABT9EJM3_9SPHN|nr:WecB/TagA/CpsF family glycosyltransferase [Sphingomonas sp. KR1UV-12]MDP1027146.1 WecB/TagA/CpsF family glycosyltransferase [Sphingomonas sp. KR1UV-12]